MKGKVSDASAEALLVRGVQPMIDPSKIQNHYTGREGRPIGEIFLFNIGAGAVNVSNVQSHQAS
ncbi:MAG TPA: hypothetical protein VNT76_10995 [Candidatus Binatus sp.]|nr:hypothetical protein [Candidatus Binatus sp.]